MSNDNKRHSGAITNISIIGTSPEEQSRVMNVTASENTGEDKITFTRKRKL